ncbi:MAG: hypothetical protein Q4G60_14905 [bacterium]|nr:hypothetical protein [bacterium]
MSKAAGSISMIGGSDGPTSVFLVGSKYKEKNPIKRCKHALMIRKHRNRIKKARRSIEPGTHTLDETICYMKEHYGMREADHAYPFYEVYIRRMRFSLVQREQLDLLPKQPELTDFHDKEAVARWHIELDEWEKQAEAIVEKLSPEVFNMDYRLFILDQGEDGSMQVELEMNRGLIVTQYSGRGFEPIQKDIYRYYGVSKEDIVKETERYQNLVTIIAQ